MFNFMKKKKN